MLQLVLWALLALPVVGNATRDGASPRKAAQPSQQKSRATTASPHGPMLNLPCENCHSATAWRPIKAHPEFDHNNTKYPLRGMHEKVDCTRCHVKPVFTDVGKNCQDCHTDVHQRRMGTNCAQCHTVQGWNVAVQQVKDHQNRFPLLGAHAAAQCEDCHKGAAVGQFQGLSTACISCHRADFQKTTNPNHVTGQFPQNCQMCHTFDSWMGATFNHAGPPANFPLTGAHATIACTACHINNNYNLTTSPNACGTSGCHLTTWQQTNNPVHSSAGAPFAAANCANCHNTIAWTTAAFDHSTTGWPLTGSHQLSPAGKVNACTDCHVNNNYNFTSANTDCYGCHQAAWNSTPTFGGNVPNHITAGFPTSLCSTCHDTVLWTDGKFDHSTTGFPLQGPHMLPPRTTVTGAIGAMVNACTDCHSGGNYTAGYPTTDCYGCHQSYYTNAQTYGASVPNHVAALYPTTCVTCHTTYVTTAWTGAVFNHTFFRLPHPALGTAAVCSDCHINSADYSQFSCINCHTTPCSHGKTGTDQEHTNVGGYVYAATTCYNCHKGCPGPPVQFRRERDATT